MTNQFPGSDGLSNDSLFRITFVVVAILAIAAFRSAFSAYFMLDDFGMLAIVRFIDNPLDPFFQDQFPGGVYYRPLGMLLWWLSEWALGLEPMGHYCLNLLLHGLVAVALGTLVKEFCGSRWAGLAAAAVFVLHPVGIGTTLWLSDRFDLLALLFGLLGMHAALRFIRDHNRLWLWTTLVLLGLSLLSKEIALVWVAGAGMLWLAAQDGRPASQRLKRCLYLLLPVIFYLIARALIFNHDHVLARASTGNLPKLYMQGSLSWLAGWADYSVFWARMDGWKKIMSMGAFGMLVVLGLASARYSWAGWRRLGLLVGLAIWLSSGFLQSPLLAVFTFHMDKGGSAIDTVMSARHFYTSLAGALIALASLLTPLAEGRVGRRMLAISLVALLVPWFSASQNLARAHRNETQHVQSLVAAANAAIGRLDLPARGCQIYLLDTDAWSFGWISDEAIKATAPDLKRIARCLVQTEHTPWYHVAIMDSLDRRSLLPMTLMDDKAELSTMRDLGKAKMLILNLDARSVVPDDSRAKFLSWQDGAFIDVTADVLSGRRDPGFVCNRSKPDCPP